MELAALMAHPPVLVPQIGGECLKVAQASSDAMVQVSQILKRKQPDAVVVISPHSPRRSGAFGIWSGSRLSGDFREFGAANVGLDFPSDLVLADQIRIRARLNGLRTWGISTEPLDHGALVPLWFLRAAGWTGPTVVLGLNFPGEGGLIQLGQSLAAATLRSGRRIALIASGDLSHRLTPTAPAGFSPRARDFDRQFIDCLRRGSYHDLEHFDLELESLAAEDALASVLVAVSAVDWDSTGHRLLSYEGPFGVGYGVAILFESPPVPNPPILAQRCHQVWAGMLPWMARESLKGLLFETLQQAPPFPNGCLAARRGVFVTIRRPGGELRGCVGTLQPHCDNLLEETRYVARLAALCDTRFPAVTSHEFQNLRFEVSVVEPLEGVSAEAQLDPERYGVVIRTADGREGCLLPQVPEIRTIEQQLQFARRKAGIGPEAPVQLQRFRAPKFHEAETTRPPAIIFRPVMKADHQASWWAFLPDGRIECQLCPRACKLQEGQRGFCFVRQRLNRRLVLTTYGRTSGLWVDPVEKKPLNHFFPGSSVLSFGSVGCNLGCRFCQNWELSKAREVDRAGHSGAPEAIAKAAKKLRCKAVAFTYNDPVIFAEYAMDVAQACHAAGVQTIAVTAGYINPQPRAEFSRHLDAANVDLKGFTEQFYHKLCLGRLGPVLETLEYLHRQTKVWLEVTSLLIPDENDQERQLHWAAEWFAEHLGPEVPWHFTAFHPDFKMLDKPPTPLATLDKARTIALSKGLHYVYTGNVRDPGGNSTRCPECHRLLIRREGYEIGAWNLQAGACGFCGHPIPGKFEDQPGAWGSQRLPVELE